MKSHFFSTTSGLILLAAVVMAGLFVNLGGVPLFDEDEGAYAEVTREMLENHDWVTPRLNGRPFFHKPPMIYWSQAVCVRLFGLNEYALRLPSALAALAWAVVLFFFVNHFIGRQNAWFAVFFLITAVQTNLISKAALADTLLNLFITCTLLSVYAYHQHRRRIFLFAAYLAMGLGFMTKGPIAVVIPAAATTLYYLTGKQVKALLHLALQPLGWLLFFAVTTPWYLVLYKTHGAAFIQEFFFVHNVGRFMRPMEGHSGSVFYYIPIILLGLLPYTTLCVTAFYHIREQWRDDLGRFLLMWFAFVLIFFSFAGTKLHHYIVYGYVPLLVFMSMQVKRVKNSALLTLPALIFFAFLWSVPFVARTVMDTIRDDFARVIIADAIGEFGIQYALITGVGFAAVVSIGYMRRITVSYKIVGFGLILTCMVNFYLIPKVAGIMQTPVKEAALIAKKSGYDVVMWKMNYPSFNVYYGRQVLKRPPRDGDVIITKATKLKQIASYSVIFKQYGIVLAKVDKFKSESPET